MDHSTPDVSSLDPARLHELVERLAQRKKATAQEASVPRRQRRTDRAEERLPLAAPQRWLWLVSSLAETGAAYHIAGGVALTGRLDVARLAAALGTVERRHEALRTALVARPDGETEQQIAPAAPGPAPLPVVDLSALGDRTRSRAAEEAASRLARAPFDLHRSPLWRAALLALAPEEHRLVLCLHHLVADGWSLRLMIEEIGRLYADDGELEPPAVQYADWALWQERRLTDGVAEAQLAHWRERLEALPPRAPLPVDRPRRPASGARGGRRSLRLPAAARRELARREGQGTTRFALWLAALAALLQRYGAEDEVVVGMPVAGRGRPELDRVIGCFVNSVVLRIDVSGDPTFDQLVERAAAVSLDAQAHAELPFDRLVGALAPDRSPGENPLFDVMIAPETSSEALALPGLKATPFDVSTGAAQLDLTLTFDGDTAAFEYRSDLFDDGTVERLLEHLGALLAAVADRPGAPLSELPLVGPKERRRLLEEAAGPIPVDSVATLPEALAASRWARRPAIVAGERVLDHGEVARRAAALARRLRAAGAGPEVRVAVLAERSVETLLALLAVWRSGAAYLTLDPAHPAHRLVELATAADARVLVADPTAASALGEGPWKVVSPTLSPEDLDGDAPAAAGPSGPVDGESLAYVLYTSGSTGRPKGVAVSHRALAAHAAAVVDAYGLGPDDRVLQLHSLGFDVAAEEIFPTWLAGGAVVLGPASAAEAVPDLTDLIETSGVTVVNLAASLWHQWLGQLARAGRWLPRSLRLVVTGSEAVPSARLDDWWRAADGGAELLNAYGLTETTVTSTVWRAPSAGPWRGGATLPVGRPLAGERVLVLEPSGEPAPVGLPGELHLGGEGLARGYLDAPAQTAERFVPDPYGAPGARLYRTGDRVRLLADGALEFLGRVDRQVQVRGHRVEPTEVEAAIGRAGRVREAAVVATPDRSRLVAYVVPAEARGAGQGQGDDDGGAEISTATLRARLADELPAYLVPDVWTVLERLPRMPSGKVDLAALPAPELDGPEAGSAPAPRTATEEVVAGAFARALALDADRTVRRDESFFELGGDSLRGASVVAELRRQLGVELPLADLFRHPTVAGLASRVAELGHGGSAAAAVPLVPVDHRGDPPVSFAQERLWLLDRLEPGAAHVLPMAVRLDGALDARALVAALGRVVARHESLRTTFPTGDDGRPVERIAPASEPLPVERVDLTHLPRAERAAAAHRAAERLAREPFDLAVGPLVRAALVAVDAEEHLLVLVLHHAVADGWSLGLLLGELAELYGAGLDGRPAELPELEIQYADYAVWQRRWLDGPAGEALVDWWRDTLAGVPPRLELPTDRPRPAAWDPRGRRVEILLPEPLAAGLARLARDAGATLFMVLLAAWAAMLRTWARQDDLPLGTYVANRSRAEVEPLIGFFVNNLVLRLDTGDDRTLADLLDRSREVSLAAHAHQDLPFERLLEAVQPPRTPRHAPLFQTLLVLQNTPAPPFELPGLRLQREPSPRHRADFDLALWVEPAASFGRRQLTAALELPVALFDRATGERLLTAWQRTLETLVDSPERRLDEISLLGPEAVEEVLASGRGAPVADPDGGGVHLAFHRAAERRPEALALVDLAGERDPWTYGELDRWARRIAAAAADRRGAGGTARVAVVLERSFEMVAAFLGCLDAGVSYLPLDPAHPEERLRRALEVGAARLVIARRRTAERLGVDGDRLLAVEELGEISPEAAPAAAHPQAAAYVIFTSGSTGEPKGVEVSHGALAAFVADAREAYGFAAGERVLQFFSPAFDASCEEIYPALAAGSTLVLRDEAMLASVEGFLERVEAARLAVLDLPTGFWRQLAAGLARGLVLPRSVRLVVIGGEAASAASVRAWLEAAPACRLVNTYGPTEATVVSTRQEMTAGGWVEPPIGRPIRGDEAHVATGGLRLLPSGAVGELWLGGAGLARGYLGDPRLSAERFVPDPWSRRPGARLYRTGDLARRLTDGSLEFRGRADRQVKVRGFRVEPAEIAAVVESHPAVDDCLVVGLPDEAAGVRLVAYVTTSGADLEPGVLREHVRRRLPDYMVPRAWVELDRFPLTSSGKVDRTALPAPAGRRADTEDEYVPPRGPTEEALAAIWRDLLGLDRVSAQDDFYELGGHSLLATQMVARVREALGAELELVSLFEMPTVAALARRLNEAGPSSSLALPPIQRVGRDHPLSLTFSQERIWFLSRLDPDSTAYHVPRAIRIDGPFDPLALRWAFTSLLERHEVLRTTFPEIDGEPVQVVTPPAPFPLRRLDLSALPEELREEELRRLLLLQGTRPFDLARGPMLRAMLVELGPDDWCMAQCEHHLVHDGWAEGVLVGDLLELYQAHREGRESRLAELPFQFADFASWQREWLVGDVLERQLAYWTDHLRGAPAVLDLPLDRPRPPVRDETGGLITEHLTVELSEELRAFARRERATLYMITLTAFFVLLTRITGQRDLVTGSAFANRRLRESEGMLGMIINTVALRLDAGGDPTFRQLLEQVRQVCLGAYAHQDLPFERVVDALATERSAAYTPVFQAIFAFHDVPEPELELPGLELDSMNAHNRSAKFDLNLLLVPEAGAGDGERHLVILAEYAQALFDRTTVARFLEQLRRIVTAAAADPLMELSALPLLDPAERHQLVAEERASLAPAPTVTAVDRVLARITQMPDATAVVHRRSSLDYRALGERSEALARRLRSAGVGRETRVAVLLERSVDLPLALLAVWRAGGAVVPLDPHQPEARLAGIVEDALGGRDDGVLLTSGDLEARARELVGERARLLLVEDEASGAVAAAADPLARPEPGDLAYVLFTSGTTGRPKGVLVEHGQLASTLAGLDRIFAFDAADRMLSIAAATFDFFFCELLAPLTHGGTLEILDLHPLDLDDLVAALDRATVFQAVPSLMGELLARLAPGATGGRLRWVLSGGEAVSAEQLTAMEETFPGARSAVLYGPTETTIVCSVHVRHGGEGARSSIGRRVDDATLTLFDARGEPVPLGVTGELWVGGHGVARGYLHRPALTAERFVPDADGRRRYRTGDLARRLADGSFEFLGRIDGQVKIRGYRIETGEIAAALAEHPEVAEVVVAPTTVGEDLRLAAWLVPVPGSTLGDDPGAHLRPFLGERLPDYMVPSFFLTVTAIPRTTHSKVDRAALPAPELAAFEELEERVPPATPTEEMVAAVWAEVLGVDVDRLSTRSSFFELGGHSLLATRCVSRLERAFGVEVPLRSLFDRPTIVGVAEILDTRQLEAADAAQLERLLDAMGLENLGDDEIAALLTAADGEEEAADG